MQELGNALLRRLIDQYKVENSFLGAFSKSDSTEMERLSNEILCNRTEINIIKGLEPGIALGEAIREKYGLSGGKGKSNKTIADNFRRRYGEVHGYTWNMARVANELQTGLSMLSYYSLQRYADEIKKIFMM